MNEYKLKNDRFRRARGGKAFLISLACAHCGTEIMVYQKDGDGQLKRCYFNRIHAPVALEALQKNAAIRRSEDAPNLSCPRCKGVIGTPILHHDGRLAFKLRRGLFLKRRISA